MIHTYNLGHFNLEAYVQMVHAADNMLHNKYAVNAAIGIVESLSDLDKDNNTEL